MRFKELSDFQPVLVQCLQFGQSVLSLFEQACIRNSRSGHGCERLQQLKISSLKRHIPSDTSYTEDTDRSSPLLERSKHDCLILLRSTSHLYPAWIVLHIVYNLCLTTCSYGSCYPLSRLNDQVRECRNVFLQC